MALVVDVSHADCTRSWNALDEDTVAGLFARTFNNYSPWFVVANGQRAASRVEFSLSAVCRNTAPLPWSVLARISLGMLPDYHRIDMKIAVRVLSPERVVLEREFETSDRICTSFSWILCEWTNRGRQAFGLNMGGTSPGVEYATRLAAQISGRAVDESFE